MPEFFARTRATLSLASILLISSALGCKSLSKAPVAENVVESRALSSQAMDAMQRERFEEAEKLFAQAIQICPVDERARCRYAELLWRRGEQQAAIEQMQEAVRLSAGESELSVQLGHMYLARNETPQALAHAQQALHADFQNADAWALQGDGLYAIGSHDDALASYHRALSLREHFPHVQLAVAEIYRMQQRPERALATLTALEDRYGPDQAPAEVLVRQGIVLTELGRFNDAAQRLADAIQRAPQHPDTYYALAYAHYRAGDVVSARLAADAGLRHAPEHARCLALIHTLNQGNITAALPQ